MQQQDARHQFSHYLQAQLGRESIGAALEHLRHLSKRHIARVAADFASDPQYPDRA